MCSPQLYTLEGAGTKYPVCALACPDKKADEAIFGSTGNYRCISQCSDSATNIYLKNGTNECLASCAYYDKSDPSQTKCVPDCASLSSNIFKLDSGKKVCHDCSGTNEVVHTTLECNTDPCKSETTNMFTSSTAIKKCVPSCPKFVDNTTYECLDTCLGATAGYVVQTTGPVSSHVCYSTCPAGSSFVDADASLTYEGAKKCVSACTDRPLKQ